MKSWQVCAFVHAMRACVSPSVTKSFVLHVTGSIVVGECGTCILTTFNEAVEATGKQDLICFVYLQSWPPEATRLKKRLAP